MSNRESDGAQQRGRVSRHLTRRNALRGGALAALAGLVGFTAINDPDHDKPEVAEGWGHTSLDRLPSQDGKSLLKGGDTWYWYHKDSDTIEKIDRGNSNAE